MQGKQLPGEAGAGRGRGGRRGMGGVVGCRAWVASRQTGTEQQCQSFDFGELLCPGNMGRTFVIVFRYHRSKRSCYVVRASALTAPTHTQVQPHAFVYSTYTCANVTNVVGGPPF